MERLTSKYTEVEDGCWEWHACKNVSGYGRIAWDGWVQLAHRVTYQVFVGGIPKGLVIDHLCRNKSCVNPSHLEPVTFVENVRRGNAWKPENVAIMQAAGVAAKKAKTHCKRGHPYSGDNLYLIKTGGRGCKACQGAAAERYRERKKAQNQSH